VSILSPKIALFFAALFSPFVAEVHQVSGKMLMVATPWLVDGLWYTLIACLLSNARFLEKLRSQAMWIDRLSGLALIFLALYILTTI
jgi:threonine/homoserine/homoserine lactone efflux protein